MHSELKKHIKAAASYEVGNICKPLFDNFDITMFVCSKVFKSGYFWTLSNRADWVEYFYLNKYTNPNVFEEEISSGYYFDLSVLKIPAVQFNIAREEFNAEYWLNIIKTYDDYYEVYGFATSRNNSAILNTYINHRDIFEHFILYFKDQASGLIKNADNNSVLLPSLKINNSALVLPSDNFLSKKEKFYSETPVKRYYINTHQGEICLTKRQFECLSLLAKGKKLKEIASNFNLSVRTVGAYIDNIKLKLGCYTRSQLLDLFVSSNWESI